MRSLLLVAGAALALAGCGDNAQTENTANLEQTLAAENISANDITAIDAVTGEAANMAADVDYANAMDNALDNATGNNAAATSGRPPSRRPRAPGRPPLQLPAPSDPAATNSL